MNSIVEVPFVSKQDVMRNLSTVSEIFDATKAGELQPIDPSPTIQMVHSYTAEYFGDERANKIITKAKDTPCFLGFLDNGNDAQMSLRLTATDGKIQAYNCIIIDKRRVTAAEPPCFVSGFAHEAGHNANAKIFASEDNLEIMFIKAGCSLTKVASGIPVYELGRGPEEGILTDFQIYVFDRFCQDMKIPAFGLTLSNQADVMENIRLMKKHNRKLFDELVDMQFEDDFAKFIEKRMALGAEACVNGKYERNGAIRDFFQACKSSLQLPPGDKRNKELFKNFDYKNM